MSLKRTKFQKTVVSPKPMKRILFPASDNAKLGDGKFIITKSEWAGMPMFYLTLEERKTCPPECHHWDDCYGNNMPFAKRINHESPGFLPKLGLELRGLAEKYPKGFVVRLHVLGDFYSPEYVKYWGARLHEFPSLRVFGYTACTKENSPAIWSEIEKLLVSFPKRWKIRQSISKAYDGKIAYASKLEDNVKQAIACPEQTGKTNSCTTCGLCWSINKTIAFATH